MQYRIPYALAGLAVFTGPTLAAPFQYPLSNGFPNTQGDANIALGKAAGGNWANTPLASTLDEDIATSLKLVAFNELFEVAFFSDLISKVTKGDKGYEIADGTEKARTLLALNKILAQEEIHALDANKLLQVAKIDGIQPCQYNFPVQDYGSAIALANTFTDVTLGTLGDIQALAATRTGNGAAGFISAMAGIIGQEGQQDGWFRTLTGKTPSAGPFLTPGARELAYTALQDFIVPGSCPNDKSIPLRVFQKLTVNSKVEELKQAAPVGFEATNNPGAEQPKPEEMKLVFINGAVMPYVKDIKDCKQVEGKENVFTFNAEWPDDPAVMGGLTYAVVVKGAGPFQDAEAVAKAAVYGPALIEPSGVMEDAAKAPTYGEGEKPVAHDGHESSPTPADPAHPEVAPKQPEVHIKVDPKQPEVHEEHPEDHTKVEPKQPEVPTGPPAVDPKQPENVAKDGDKLAETKEAEPAKSPKEGEQKEKPTESKPVDSTADDGVGKEGEAATTVEKPTDDHAGKEDDKEVESKDLKPYQMKGEADAHHDEGTVNTKKLSQRSSSIFGLRRRMIS